MTIKKKIAAIAAAAMMAMSMTAISASASVGDSFSLSNYNTKKGMLVTNLEKDKDTGIDFVCNTFDSNADTPYIEGDIPTSMKKRTSEYAILNGDGDKETIIFKTGWHNNGEVTACSATVTLYGYSGYTVSASGIVK